RTSTWRHCHRAVRTTSREVCVTHPVANIGSRSQNGQYDFPSAEYIRVQGSVKKKGPRRAPSNITLIRRSEVLLVTEVRRTAVGVVQVEIERTAVVGNDLRHLVSDVVHAKGDVSVP